jgi:hypothetical protein
MWCEFSAAVTRVSAAPPENVVGLGAPPGGGSPGCATMTVTLRSALHLALGALCPHPATANPIVSGPARRRKHLMRQLIGAPP